MEIKDLLREDATKKVYATNQNDQVIVAFNDAGSAKGKKKDEGSEIAQLNNAVSSFLFDYLESYNVPTYFVRKLDEKSFLARKTEPIPIIVAVYNVASPSLSARFGIEAGKVLEFPIVELYYNDEAQGRPMINEYHAYAMGLCERKEMTSIMRIATKVNAVLKSFFDRKGLKLVNFQLQFGRMNSQIVLCDELSLDTINLWLQTNGALEEIPEGGKKGLAGYRSLKAQIFGE